MRKMNIGRRRILNSNPCVCIFNMDVRKNCPGCLTHGYRLVITVRQTQIANIITAQLLFLESTDPKRDIIMYVNSPGGSVYAGLGMYDTMQYKQLIRNCPLWMRDLDEGSQVLGFRATPAGVD